MSEYEALVEQIVALQKIRADINESIVALERKSEQLRYAEFDLPRVPGWYIGENSDAPIRLDVDGEEYVWDDGYGNYIAPEAVADEGPLVRLVPERGESD